MAPRTMLERRDIRERKVTKEREIKEL